MNKLIEAEIKEFRASTPPWNSATGERKLREALHRFEKALREDILSKLPREKHLSLVQRQSRPPKRREAESVIKGHNNLLSQVKNIIKPRDV